MNSQMAGINLTLTEEVNQLKENLNEYISIITNNSIIRRKRRKHFFNLRNKIKILDEKVYYSNENKRQKEHLIQEISNMKEEICNKKLNLYPMWRYIYNLEKHLAEDIIRQKNIHSKSYRFREKENEVITLERKIRQLQNETTNNNEDVIEENKKQFKEKAHYLSRICPEILYNPIDYAAGVHIQYLQKYLTGTKKVIFIGMNPGYFGMTQTGVPFGEIHTVKNRMKLKGKIVHKRTSLVNRPITGLETTRREGSGTVFWDTMARLTNECIDTFFVQCFMMNFGPITFFNRIGETVTQAELLNDYKSIIIYKCLKVTEDIIRELEPNYIVGIGNAVYEWLIKSAYLRECKTILKVSHPSSLNRNNRRHGSWEQSNKGIIEQLLPYITNSINSNV